MTWYEHLYTGASISDVPKIKRQIRHRRPVRELFLITLASNAQNLLDIVPAWNLCLKGYPREEMRVVGLARGYGEAVELVRQIVQEAYDHTGDTDVRSYLHDIEVK